MKNIALITAAGKGTRLQGLGLPKQFLRVNGKPILIYSAEAFNNNELIDEIYIITSKEYIEEVTRLCRQYNISKLKAVIEGGQTRQQSVFNGLTALKSHEVKDGDLILVHDGARPLIDDSIINININGCLEYNAVETVIPATDTIIISNEGQIIDEIPNREGLYQVQTPQTFRFKLIYDAHKRFESLKLATDDAQLVHNMGKPVHLVEGNKRNIKITTIEDLQLMKSLLE